MGTKHAVGAKSMLFVYLSSIGMGSQTPKAALSFQGTMTSGTTGQQQEQISLVLLLISTHSAIVKQPMGHMYLRTDRKQERVLDKDLSRNLRSSLHVGWSSR